MSQVESLSFLALDSPKTSGTNITVIKECCEQPKPVECCEQPKPIECCDKPKPAECCEPKPVCCSTDSGWEWLGSFILWFIVFIVLFWLIFYSLKPPFVLQSDSNQVDTAKVLLAAVISAFILVVLVYLIKACFSK